MNAPSQAGRSGPGLLRDPRVWLGIAITVAAAVFTVRGIDFSEVGRALSKATLGGIAVGIVANVVTTGIRAFRWRPLAAHVADVPVGAAFRASAIGFLVNSILPLRIGEVVRPWVLSREIGASGPALFGTVVLERVLDALAILVIGGIVLGGQDAIGLVAMLLVVPIGGIVLLRLRPEWPLGWARMIFGWVLPEALVDRIDALLRGIADGLAGLRGGARIAAVLGWTALLWGIVTPLTFLGPMASLGVAAGLWAAPTVMIYVAIAVAIPSAPGFFGVYHAACREALVPLGVAPETAIAVGTLAHLLMWLTFIALGLACLRASGARLADVLRGAETATSD